ncbi:MAG: rod shape-determining protein [Pyrinomonadaceae bacterium]
MSILSRSRTSSFWEFSKLRELVSDSLAIDMGSASTIIAVRGRGVIIDEPSVVAVDRATGEVIAYGREADEMYGREARDVTLISPLVDGVVADFERTQKMLDHFVRAARSGISHFSRRAIMGVLAGVTQVERRALLAAAEYAHIGRVYMVEEGLAAALGAGVSIEDRHASVVVDFGGNTTNIAAVVRGVLVYARAERIGSTNINAALTDRLRRHRGLIIGRPTARELKMKLGSAMPPVDPSQKMTARGREVQTGNPHAIELTAEEIYEVAQPVVQRITEFVRASLAELPPEVSADVFERGFILTGGGALLTGLVEYLQRETKLLVRLADEPRLSIVHGLMHLYDEPLLLRRITRNEPSFLFDAGVGAFEA